MGIEAGKVISTNDLKAFLTTYGVFNMFMQLHDAPADVKESSIASMLRASPAYILENGGSFFWREDPSTDWEEIHEAWYQLCEDNEQIFDGYLPDENSIVSVCNRGSDEVKELAFITMTKDRRYLCYDDDRELSATAYDYIKNKDKN